MTPPFIHALAIRGPCILAQTLVSTRLAETGHRLGIVRDGSPADSVLMWMASLMRGRLSVVPCLRESVWAQWEPAEQRIIARAMLTLGSLAAADKGDSPAPSPGDEICGIPAAAHEELLHKETPLTPGPPYAGAPLFRTGVLIIGDRPIRDGEIWERVPFASLSRRKGCSRWLAERMSSRVKPVPESRLTWVNAASFGGRIRRIELPGANEATVITLGSMARGWARERGREPDHDFPHPMHIKQFLSPEACEPFLLALEAATGTA